MTRLLETIAPRRLGAGFRWLVASSWATNLGDGIALAAGWDACRPDFPAAAAGPGVGRHATP